MRFIVIAAALLAAALSYLVFRAAARSMQNARRYPAYAMQRRYKTAALRQFIAAGLLFLFALFIPAYGTPVVYFFSPPSPTPSPSPTAAPLVVAIPPTETSLPAETTTPLPPGAPTATVTPFIPVAIEAMFKGLVTPNPEAVFTEIQFSTKFDGVNPIDPQKSFRPPIQTIYGGFDYNNLIPETQWTALWYRDGNLVCYETKPWDGGTGGIGGYTECANPFGGWQPGNYEVQIFMGYELKKIGRFVVLPNPTPTAKP